MSERDDFGTFLLGFIIGGLTGAVVALMLAPQSGEETRTVIKEKAIELRDMAEKTAGEVSTKASEEAAQLRKQAEEAYTTTRTRADEVIGTAKQRADDVISTAKQRVTDRMRRGQVTLEEEKKPEEPAEGEAPEA
jgi:gas vesicle protein